MEKTMLNLLETLLRTDDRLRCSTDHKIPLSRKRNWEKPSCENNFFWLSSMRRETLTRIPKWKAELGKRQPTIPNPTEITFTNFPKGPFCYVCPDRTRKVQKQTSLITADHNILNLDDDSINDHQDALVVQDGSLC